MNFRILCVWITWILLRSGSSYINYVNLGCYTDDEDRMLDVKIDDGSMTIELCYNKCSKYSHFGLQNGRECFCGNSTADENIYPRRPENECNMACAGNKSQTCGGFWRMSVYRRVLAETTSAANTVTTSLPDLTSPHTESTVTMISDMKSPNTESTVIMFHDLTSPHTVSTDTPIVELTSSNTDQTVTTLFDLRSPNTNLTVTTLPDSTATALPDLKSSNTNLTINSCECPCSNVGQNRWLFLQNFNLTMQEIKVIMQPELEALQIELRVKKSNTSRLLRSKTSATDDRISSITIGYIGIIFICVIFFLPVFQDILRCVCLGYSKTHVRFQKCLSK